MCIHVHIYTNNVNSTCVTFGVYIQFPPYIVVSAAFWATLKGDTARVVMTVL